MTRTRPSLRALLAATATLALGGSAALAGGLQRPNMVGTRSIGFGGAYAAIADDPTALFHNPAGLTQIESLQVLVAGDFIYAPRSYTPLAEDGTVGDKQASDSHTSTLPLAAVARRFALNDGPTRLVFGIGAWSTFGGAIGFENDPAAPLVGVVDKITNAIFEITPGLGYAVNEVLSVGAALRVGVGIFDLVATEKPINSELRSSGVGLGYTLGATVRPTKAIAVSTVYRSSLNISTKGDGVVEVPGPSGTTRVAVDVNQLQEWPSFMSLGLAYRVSPALTVSTQLDRTDWSVLDDLLVEFPAQQNLSQRFDLSWTDSYAAHLGANYVVSPKLSVRGGMTYDTSAVPDRTVERQYLDNDNVLLGLGTTAVVSAAWSLDFSAEYLVERPREIANNTAEARDAGWIGRANVAPGTYEGSLWTAMLALRYGR